MHKGSAADRDVLFSFRLSVPNGCMDAATATAETAAELWIASIPPILRTVHMAKAGSASGQLAEARNAIIALLLQHQARQRSEPGVGFLTWNQLLQALPQPHHEVVRQSLAKTPAKSVVVVAVPDDPDSPVAIVEDLESLAASEQLLLRLILHTQYGCSADNPLRPLTELVKAADKRLQKPMLASWSLETLTPPAGIVAVRTVKGRKTQVSFHDTRFPRSEEQLAGLLLAALSEAPADHARPFTTLADLLALANIAADNPALPAALALPEVQAHFRTIRGRGMDAWIVDSECLSYSLSKPALLTQLLTETCSPSIPVIRLSALAKLFHRDVQSAFIAAWLQPDVASLLSTVCCVTPAGTPRKPDLLLHDLRFPSPEQVASEKLVQILERAKADTESQYPVRWLALQQSAGPDSPREVLHRATLAEPFSSRAIIACPNAPDSPVFLTMDLESCVRSGAMLSFLVRRATADDNIALSPQKLSAAAGLHPIVRQVLNTVAEEIISGMPLPPGIGLARIARKWQLLDLSRVRVGAGSGVPPVTSDSAAASSRPAADSDAFSAAFDAAFARLSRTSHLPGYVSLADLRPALSEYPREVFDSQLQQLRRAGLYSLSLLEGRMALSAAEESAVMVIDNRRYLLVHRR